MSTVRTRNLISEEIKYSVGEGYSLVLFDQYLVDKFRVGVGDKEFSGRPVWDADFPQCRSISWRLKYKLAEFDFMSCIFRLV